jgi:hypothetical protein
MEFAYDVDTFDNESKRREKGNASTEGEGLGVSLKLSSLTTSDFTKKLQSLSLIGGYSNKLNGDSTNETNKQLMSSNAKANKRARISIELLDSIGFNYNPVSGKTPMDWKTLTHLIEQMHLCIHIVKTVKTRLTS